METPVYISAVHILHLLSGDIVAFHRVNMKAVNLQKVDTHEEPLILEQKYGAPRSAYLQEIMRCSRRVHRA